MPQTTISLPEVHAVHVTVVMDNSIDLLMVPTEVAQRFPLGPNPFDHPIPIAEHGFSVLISVKQREQRAAPSFLTLV